MQTQLHRASLRARAVFREARRHLRQLTPLGRSLRRHVTLAAPALAGIALSFGAPVAQAQTASFNYAEALQKSLYFYDAEKSGPGITGGRLQWRGDSALADQKLPLVPKGSGNIGTNLSQAFITANRAALDPDGDGFVDVSGGFHDAGDHVRFGLPQAYAASTLAWGFFEFPTAFVQSGQRDHMVEELRWFADCFLRSTFRNSSGAVVAFCYQVGEGSVDHTIWAPPEIINPALVPRPAYFATAETPASDQVAGHAAALAAIGLALQTIDAPYSARCIETARALYNFAVAHRGLGYSGGFYNSSFDEDELSWAAVWLLSATSDARYLSDIEATTAGGQYTGYLKRITTSTADNWQNTWVHSWDTVWAGVFVRLAAITNSPRYTYYATWNVEYWSGVPHADPRDTNFLKPSPAGYRVITTWGSARYNCAAQLCALVMRKYTGRTEFADWARGQMNYIMGNNPMNRSYIVGFPTPAASAQHPHHRAAHGSISNNENDPVTHRHVLWGALVGGPDITDFHRDQTSDFIYNEVAIDYNAGLVGALAGLYTYYGAGQQPLANFPPVEPAGEPYVAQARLEQENAERTQVTIRGAAVSLLPPRFETALKARYFFDISELVAAGQSIADVRVELNYDQEKAISGRSTLARGPISWDGGTVYYVELDWTGAQIFGTRDIQFGIVARADSRGRTNWNPANDWSRLGLTAAFAARPNVTLYRGNTLVYGQEPAALPVANYSLLSTPAALSLAQGSSATSSIAIARTNGFTGAVALAASGLPAGVTASITPATTTGATATLTLTAAPTAAVGAATVTLTGTGTPGARTTTLNLAVTGQAVSDFALTATPASLTINRGATGTSAIAITRTGGFAGPVTLSATGLPTGVTATFSPNPATGATSTLTFSTSATATVGPASVIITGTGAPGARTRTLSLTVGSPTTTTPCSAPSPATLPLRHDGVGDTCQVTAGNVTFVNSWNMQLVEINGVDFTNKWANSMPPRINGNYYIRYVATVPWAHLEVNGTP